MFILHMAFVCVVGYISARFAYRVTYEYFKQYEESL